MDERTELKIFEQRHEFFPQDRHSEEYKKINSIRANLLKINEKEAKNYISQNLKINSHTTKEYLKKCFENITINLRTKQIQSSKKTRVSFLENIEDLDLHPFFQKRNFHSRKKLVLSKQFSNYESESENEEEKNFIKDNIINNKDYNLFLFNEKIDSGIYFDFLYSLFFSLHKNVVNRKKQRHNKVKNYSQNHRLESSPSIKKIKNSIIDSDRNYNSNLKRSNSNEHHYGIIKLIPM